LVVRIMVCGSGPIGVYKVDQCSVSEALALYYMYLLFWVTNYFFYKSLDIFKYYKYIYSFSDKKTVKQ